MPEMASMYRSTETFGDIVTKEFFWFFPSFLQSREAYIDFRRQEGRERLRWTYFESGGADHGKRLSLDQPISCIQIFIGCCPSDVSTMSNFCARKDQVSYPC